MNFQIPRLSDSQIVTISDCHILSKLSGSQTLRLSETQIVSQTLRFSDSQTIRRSDSETPHACICTQSDWTLRFPSSQTLRLSDYFRFSVSPTFSQTQQDSQALRQLASQNLRSPDSQTPRLRPFISMHSHTNRLDSQTLWLSGSQSLRFWKSQAVRSSPDSRTLRMQDFMSMELTTHLDFHARMMHYICSRDSQADCAVLCHVDNYPVNPSLSPQSSARCLGE